MDQQEGQQADSARIGGIAVVGVVPGTHDLITVRGRRLLRVAELLVHPAECGIPLLGEAPPQAERWQDEGAPEQPQRALAAARAGRRVVWLTAGDATSANWLPALSAECAAGGVPLTVVPGVASAGWSNGRPLEGCRILVTRARQQAAQTCALLEQRGALALTMPTIAIVPPPDLAPLRAAVAALRSYQRLILTSANAVAALAETLELRGLDARMLAGIEVCAVGPATAERLRQLGIRADLVAKDHRAEGLLELLPARCVPGERVLLLRAARARDLLPETLRRRGAQVDVVTAYLTTLPPAEQWQAGLAALRARQVEIVLFTSASTAEHFARIVGDGLSALLAGVTVAAIGPITGAACRALGMTVAVSPPTFTLPAMVAALEQHFSARESTTPSLARTH
ncbi:MAG: uroporphyrinogen-III synthase [Proteobacteria bacterium]|nr:uroporphyrinogen-III synthase [Pseudomonadota bacterium]